MNGLKWIHFVSFSSSFPRRSGEERRLPNKPQLSRSVMDVFRLDSCKVQVGLQQPDEKSITDSILFTHIGSKDKWRAEEEIGLRSSSLVWCQTRIQITLPWVLLSFTETQWTHTDLSLVKSQHLTASLLTQSSLPESSQDQWWSVTKYNYFVTVLKYIFQVSILYWSSFILSNFYFYFTTFQSIRSYFLLHYIS